MKQNLKIVIAVFVFLGSFVTGAKSQQTVQFSVNLALAIGTARDTITVGVSGDGPGGTINDNTYNRDAVGATFGPLGLYGEANAIPGDPDGNRVRLMDIPGRTTLGQGLWHYDYRGYSSPSQVDTFAVRIDGLRVETSGVTVSWPAGLNSYGTSWRLYSRSGTTLTEVANMLTATSYSFPATGGNIQFVVIKSGAFTTDVRIVDSGIPSIFALEQNYPNPFNPSTEIRFSLPIGNTVSLKVYNMIGQEVATLVNEFKSAGTYIVQFNAAKLSSGMYMYRLQAKGLSQVKKLVLMK